jgi:predicted molibdopterin-dependent oxidoreductase YjgC
MIDASHAGEVDFFYQIGGNFLETLPDPDYVREAVERLPFRLHQDIVLSPQMMIEPQDTVLLLPAQTRYEQRGGGTETSTERRILFSPEIKGRRIGETKPEWEIPMLIAERAKPQQAALIHFESAETIRQEIAKAAPAYDGIQNLQKQGDMVQWGGERLCEDRDANGNPVPRFKTESGKAVFYPIVLAEENESQSEGGANGKLKLATRRGKQFNSIVQKHRDPLNGARRDDVLISKEDAEHFGLQNGDSIVLRSKAGELRGRCLIAPIAAGNVQAHWPEANVLLERGDCDPECGIPDYNTFVEIEKQ